MSRYFKYFMILIGISLLMLAAGCGASAVTPDPNAAKPSNQGGTGDAVKLTGDATRGAQIFDSRCATCHGAEGKGGVQNEGSEDGTVPELNPIDPSLKNQDPKVFAANLDVFIEHGSTPAGSSPSKVMLAFGDTKILQPQEIADVIAYIISLNK
jgi:mono/diheme cytochrome c family protein